MAIHRPRCLGAQHGDTRIQDRVYLSSPVRASSSSYSPAGFSIQKAGAAGRGCSLDGKERHLSHLPPIQRGFLVYVLPCTKEDGRLEAHPEPETLEQIHQASEVQDADTGLGPSLPYQRSMGSFSGPKGCIPTHPHSPQRSHMASFPLKRPSVQIQVPSLRTINSTSGVHEGRRSSGCLSEAARGKHLSVPGRLVDLRGVRGSTTLSYTAGHSDSLQTRVHRELQEVPSGADSDAHLPGCSTGSLERSSVPDRREGSQSSLMLAHTLGSAERSSSSVVKGARSHGQHGGSDPLLQTADESDPDSLPRSLSSKPPSNQQDDSYVEPCSPGTSVVVLPPQSVRGSGVSTPQDESRYHNGCVPDRMGGPPPRSGSVRLMDSARSKGAHQPSGALGCGAIHDKVRRCPAGSGCPHSDGQQHSGRLSEQAGRDSVLHPLRPCHQNNQLVPGASDSSPRDSHRGSHQCPGRQPVSWPGNRAHGASAFPPSGSDDIPEVLLPSNRPLRDSSEQAPPSVLLPILRQSRVRHGRAVDQLDGDGGVRLSPNLSPPQSDREDSARGLRSPPDRPVLAEARVVSTPCGSTGKKTLSSSSSSRPGTRRKRVQTATRSPQVDLLAIIRERCQKEGFSEGASKLIAGGRRQSTLSTYSKRLAPYFLWCSDRGISPSRAPVPVVCDFLVSKFNSGLQANTVRNYKSAIRAVHVGFPDGSSLDDSGEIRLLLDGMFNERPPKRHIVPSWDLNIVLDYLKSDAFEPMKDSSLRQVTMKTITLLALATAQRQSEIHALAVSGTSFSSSAVSLGFRPDFLAKNETKTHMHKSLIIPKMSESSSEPADRLWCPVRALRYYLSKTKGIRGDNDQLFLTHALPHKPATKSTIARWIVKTILESGANVNSEHVTAHSTRSISTSEAYHAGLTVGEICEAVNWKSSTTFSSAYFRPSGRRRSLLATAVIAKK